MHESLEMESEEHTEDLIRAIVLAGGGSLFPGIADRFIKACKILSLFYLNVCVGI